MPQLKGCGIGGLDFNAESRAGQVRFFSKRVLRFALDIPSFFADNTPNIRKAMTEESMSANAARDVWSIGCNSHPVESD